MAASAEAAGVPVSMGYNKNVTQYVADARAAEASAGAGAVTKFIHNNAYESEELDECFERNAEGMLKNMAVHELAVPFLRALFWRLFLLSRSCRAAFFA
jgi:hypothetical protein